MAKAIDNISELLTEELKGFLLEARAGSTSEIEVDVDARISQYRMRFLGLVVRCRFSLITKSWLTFSIPQGKLQAIQPQITNAKFEGGLRGPWPKAKYETMVLHVQELVGSLALLSNSWSRMDSAWAKGLVDDTPFFEPNFVSIFHCRLGWLLTCDQKIADILGVLSLCTHSLRDGQPMPASFPLIERLATHGMQRQQQASHSRHHAARYVQRDQVVRDASMFVLDSVESPKNGSGKARLNWKMLQVCQLHKISCRC